MANDHGVGVGRAQLLEILGRRARQAGAKVVTGTSVTLSDVEDADVVVAADGVRSTIRQTLAPMLDVRLEAGRLAYIWCGATLPLDGMVLALAESPHGVLAAHVMPYGNGSCTFQVDADISTVESLGLTEQSGSNGTSEKSLRFLEETFGDLLDNGRLRSNRSWWTTFTTVTCGRWSHDNVVLLGDAAHTAHYTVGSGTRLAMEDAACLADALDGSGSLDDAFTAYEEARRPVVTRLQWRAGRSQTWWSSIAARSHLPMAQLLLSYLTRTGSASVSKLAESSPDLLRECLDLFEDVSQPEVSDPTERVLAQPLRLDGRAVSNRIVSAALATDPTVMTLAVDGVRPWSPEASRLASDAANAVAKGTKFVRLAGSPDRPALLDRLDVAEQLRLTAAVPTIVVGPADCRDDLALGLLAGRADLVELPVGAAA